MGNSDQKSGAIVNQVNRQWLIDNVRAINQWRHKYPSFMRANNDAAALALASLGGLAGEW